MTKIHVIGIGYKPFDERTKEIISKSEIILASHRLFDVFIRYEEFGIVKDKVMVIDNVNETISYMKSAISTRQPVMISLLASGDPMFFGIGRRVINEFGKERVEILPDLSSIQIAFSRIKEPWDDALLISLHGGPEPTKRRKLTYKLKDIPLLLKKYKKIAILTDKENNPSEIAKVLHSSLFTRHLRLTMYVCERLGYPDEKIIEANPDDSATMSFADPNVVIIIQKR
jgi:precorrin-6Y C5,15-methyltransferase (decarboxylating)